MKSLSKVVLFVVLMAPLCLAQFKQPVFYATGEEPQEALSADFNKDGKIDLVTANYTSEDLSILIGNGDGTFKASVQYPTVTDPSAIAVGDFNRDGNTDVAAVEYGFGTPSYLQIFLGNGDGTLTAGRLYTIGSLPYGMTVSDFNGDGRLDLAVALNGVNRVDVYLGNGKGDFSTPAHYYSPLPLRVLAVDLNNDGHPDLVSVAYCGKDPNVCQSGAAQVFLNNGDGTFGHATYYDTKGFGSDGIAAADFNHDGALDLALANNSGDPSVISVFLGNGDGTLQPVVTYPGGNSPAGLAIADYNRDGELDIAAANTEGNSVTMLKGNGDGTFQTAPKLLFATGTLPIWVTAADFNRDGATDLAVTLDYANEIAVLLHRR